MAALAGGGKQDQGQLVSLVPAPMNIAFLCNSWHARHLPLDV